MEISGAMTRAVSAGSAAVEALADVTADVQLSTSTASSSRELRAAGLTLGMSPTMLLGSDPGVSVRVEGSAEAFEELAYCPPECRVEAVEIEEEGVCTRSSSADAHAILQGDGGPWLGLGACTGNF
mmetsp:Transcript_150728/g.266039  ORF Transcript_150728/g.266039 Transcript_150728/m.266039 type:complete len:126 (-) Transcript_150728:256-633(-)